MACLLAQHPRKARHASYGLIMWTIINRSSRVNRRLCRKTVNDELRQGIFCNYLKDQAIPRARIFVAGGARQWQVQKAQKPGLGIGRPAPGRGASAALTVRAWSAPGQGGIFDEAAVNQHEFTSCLARTGAKPVSGVGHVFRLYGLGERRCRPVSLAPGVKLLRAEAILQPRRLDHAGTDCIDPDLRAQCAGQAERHCIERAF